VRPFSEGKRGMTRCGSTVLEAGDTTKSDAAPGEAKGNGWRLEVKDDQRKLGQ
jgi:hypothetical protein